MYYYFAEQKMNMGFSSQWADYILVPKDAPLYVEYDSKQHGTDFPHFKLLDDLEKQITSNIEMSNGYNVQHYSEYLYTRLIENMLFNNPLSISELEWSFYDRVFCIYIISLFHLKKYSQILTKALPDYIRFFSGSNSNTIDITSSMYTSTVLHYCTLSLKSIDQLKTPLATSNEFGHLYEILYSCNAPIFEESISRSCLHIPYERLNALSEEELNQLNRKIKNDTKLFGAPDISSFLLSLADYSSQLKQKTTLGQDVVDSEALNAEFLLNLSLTFNPYNLEAIERLNRVKLDKSVEISGQFHSTYFTTLEKYGNLLSAKDIDLGSARWDIKFLVYNVNQIYLNFYNNNYYACKEIMESEAFKPFYYSEKLHEISGGFKRDFWHNNYNMIYYYLKSLVEVYEFEAAFSFIKDVFDFSKNEIPLVDCEHTTSTIDYITEIYNLISVLVWQCYKTTGDMKFLLYLKDLILFFSVRKENGKIHCMVALALMYSCLDQTDKSIEILEKAILKHPRYAYTYYLLGNEFMVKEEFGDAIKVFDIAKCKGYLSYKVHYSLGVVYLMLGEYHKSILHLSKGLQTNQVNIILLNTYGIVLEKVGNDEDAQKYFELVLELYDDHGETSTFSRGNVFRENYINIALFKVANYKFYHQHDAKGALDVLSRFDSLNISSGAGKYDSTLVNIYSLLQDIHENLGDMKSSIAFKNKVIALDPLSQGLNI